MNARRIALIGVASLLAAAGTILVSVWFFVSLPRTTVPVLPVRASGAVLWVSSPAILTSVTDQYLNDRQRQALDALVGTWGSAALGPDVSMRYDLLPALGETVLIWNEAGDWTLRSTLRTDAEPFLARLHASYRTSFPAVRRTQELLDDRFPLDMVQIEDGIVTDVITQENGWNVTVTRPISGSGTLTSARRGREIVLGNAPASVRALLRETLTPPAPWRSIPAIGSLPRAFLQSDLAQALLPAAAVEAIGGGSGDSVLWSLRQQNDILTFTMH